MITVDRETWTRWNETGEWVLFREGRLTRNAAHCLACDRTIESTYRHDYRTCGCPNGTMVDGGLDYRRWGAVVPEFVEDASEYGPPHEFVEWAQPCETCGGKRWVLLDGGPGLMGCDDRTCLDGKRCIAVAVPCPVMVDGEHPVEHDGAECWHCADTGLITVGHVVVEWGPLVVLDDWVKGDKRRGYLLVGPEGVTLVRQGHATVNVTPSGIDPATLVGKWAQGYRKVVTP